MNTLLDVRNLITRFDTEAGVVYAVMQAISFGIVDGDEILVDHQGMSLRRGARHAQAENAVSATEVEAIGVGFEFEVIEQQARSIIYGARRKQAPGGIELESAEIDEQVLADLLVVFGWIIKHGFSPTC